MMTTIDPVLTSDQMLTIIFFKREQLVTCLIGENKMKSFINSLSEKITLKTAIAATAFFLIMLWLIDFSPIGVAGLIKITGGVGILDYETRYTADFAYAWLESMTEAGRLFHLKKIMPLDIIYPPSLAFFMFSWLSLLFKKNTGEDSIFRNLLVLPFIYFLLDWIENIGITAMLVSFPKRIDAVCVATGMITSVKKTVILLIIIIFIIQLMVLLFKFIRSGGHAKIEG